MYCHETCLVYTYYYASASYMNIIKPSFLLKLISMATTSSCSIWSLLVMFQLALGQIKPPSRCVESFECGNLGYLTFPLTKHTDPGCGLSIVNCESNPPTIQLGRSEADWYHMLSRPFDNNVIRVRAPWLEIKDCTSVTALNLSNTSPSITFTFFPNITVFKCSVGTDVKSLDDHFAGYQNFTCQESHLRLYFQNPEDRDTSPVGSLPPNCHTILLPIKYTDPNQDHTDWFSIFTNEFELAWHLSDDCYGCHIRGGQCPTGSGEKFHCSYSKGSRNLGVILGAVSAGVAGILLICLAIFIVRRRRRRNVRSAYILSQKSSSDPSSKADLEAASVYPGVPVFTYAELDEATNSFDSSKELGDGGFGIVYYGKLRDGREVAVKRLYEHNYKRVEQFMNEIKILTCLRHPNLVSLYGCTSRRSRELLLVYEYVPNGTVADHLHGDNEKYRPLNWPTRMKIAIETATALTYLHASEIIHRDVKTNNILLDHNFDVKVADFGLSRLFPNNVTHVSTAPQGTPGYVDPEYHECYQLTNKSDVYSFGVVLVELISSLPAVDISRHRYDINLANLAMNRIQRCAFDELIDPSLGYESDPEVKRMTIAIAELAFRCLQADKELRPMMDEVLEALVDINEGKEDFTFEEIKKIDGNFRTYKSAKLPPSPETEDVVLLKNKKFPPPSPISVADVWISSSSTTSGGG